MGYRSASAEAVVEELASIGEPNCFIVDDVAFVHSEHGMAIADAIERRGIRKNYYLETRCDVLIRNEAVFARWAKLGLKYMFLGLESLDADQLKLFRKRVTPNQNFEALAIARRLGIQVAINLILAGQLARGQTNFLKMLFKFSAVYNAERQHADHLRPVAYEMRRPEQYPRYSAMREVMVHDRAHHHNATGSSAITGDAPAAI